MLGISQGAASAVALAATAFIIALALSAQLPTLFIVQKAGAEQAGEMEKLAAVRLSLVATFDDGTIIVSNDGTSPVTIDKLYTSGGAVSLTSPITIQPGQKVSINLGGRADALAAQLPSGQKVVLKKKAGVEIATFTTSVNPTATTRITTSFRTTTTTTTTTRTVTVTQSPTTTTITSHRTMYTTQHTPFTVTNVAAAYTQIVAPTTLTTASYVYYPNCYTVYRYTITAGGVYHTRVALPFQTTTTTTTATVRVNTQISTSLNTQDYWTHTLYIITSITSTVPSPTTVTLTNTYTERIWSPIYSTYVYQYYTWTLWGYCYNWFFTWTTTGTLTVTGMSTSATVTTTTVS